MLIKKTYRGFLKKFVTHKYIFDEIASIGYKPKHLWIDQHGIYTLCTEYKLRDDDIDVRERQSVRFLYPYPYLEVEFPLSHHYTHLMENYFSFFDTENNLLVHAYKKKIKKVCKKTNN